MPKRNNVHLWQCDLTLHDYLFFATTKRGRVRETGEFIHNYSLTYALGWARSGWCTERQEPQYEQQLGNVDGIYVTPGHLIAGSHTLMSYRTEMSGYALPTSLDQNNTNCGIVRCFRPGSVFRFYVLARFYLDNIPPLVRLGRFMTKAEVATQYPVEFAVVEGDYIASSLLNWNDIASKPSLCDVIMYALPGRLIRNARFTGVRYVEAKFVDGNTVKLPLDMGYYQNELCSTWLGDAA
ncbi:type I-D CRISPR-associated protein Cas5/Csc1 [Candidatus Poribacteria bacterium]